MKFPWFKVLIVLVALSAVMQWVGWQEGYEAGKRVMRSEADECPK